MKTLDDKIYDTGFIKKIETPATAEYARYDISSSRRCVVTLDGSDNIMKISVYKRKSKLSENDPIECHISYKELCLFRKKLKKINRRTKCKLISIL